MPLTHAPPLHARDGSSPLRFTRAATLFFSLLGLCGAARAECPRSGVETVRLKSIDDRLVLHLEDGRLIRLVGLDPALGTPSAPDLADDARVKLDAMLTGKTMALASLGAQPDRWGRIPGAIFVVGAGADSPVGGLATALVAAGLGRYLSEPAAHTCRDALLSAESAARTARLGLWNDPYYAVLAVADHAAFAERSGTLVLAEGRLMAVQPSPYRTTLRFSSPDGGAAGQPASYVGRMLVATIPPRIMKSFVAQGVDLHGLIGRHLRFRGLLDLRFGPQVELASPDDMEILAQVPQ